GGSLPHHRPPGDGLGCGSGRGVRDPRCDPSEVDRRGQPDGDPGRRRPDGQRRGGGRPAPSPDRRLGWWAPVAVGDGAAIPGHGRHQPGRRSPRRDGLCRDRPGGAARSVVAGVVFGEYGRRSADVGPGGPATTEPTGAEGSWSRL
ncbi:MAG: hypothetical protein AVDCRST_MAG73-1811, partial [uncultured Thermomicrobiales bacterium]